MVDKVDIDIVRNIPDFMKALDLRRIVFVEKGHVPEKEEFDGNDFTATHFLAKVNGKAAATCRMRYFSDFVRLERACVAPEFQHLNLFGKLWDFVKDFAEQKGIKTGYCLCEKEMIPHWEKRGFTPIEDGQPLQLGERTLYPVLYRFKPSPNAVHLNSNPKVMIAPEGQWEKADTSTLSPALLHGKNGGRG